MTDTGPSASTRNASSESALSPSPVRWLLLDIGGVIEITDDESWPLRWAARWASRLALSPDDFVARLRAADLPDAATRTGVAEEYWRRTGEAVGADAVTLTAMRADFWDEYCGELDQELLSALAELRDDVGLAILSNSGDGAREEEERRFGLSALFDPILYSHEIGVAKPDPAAFEIALDRLDAAADEVLFVDNAAVNVAAARTQGLRAHLHVDTPSSLAVIRAAIPRRL